MELVKVREPLIQGDCCAYEKRRETHTQGKPREDEAEMGVTWPQATDGQQYWKLEEEREDSPPRFAGSPAGTLIVDLQPPELGENTFLLLEATLFVVLC